MPTTPQSQKDHAATSTPTPDTPTMACYTGYEVFPKSPPRVLLLTTCGKSKPSFEGNMTDDVGDLLHAQYKLSLLQWNAGAARRQPTQLVTAMCGAFNAVLLQEARDHVQHISDQFQVYTNDDDLAILLNRDTFFLDAIKYPIIEESTKPHGVSRPWWFVDTYAGHQLEPPKRSTCARYTCTT